MEIKVRSGSKERYEVLSDGGVVLLRAGSGHGLRRRLRRAFRLYRGLGFAWVVDDPAAADISLPEWQAVVCAASLPAAVVVEERGLLATKEKSARLAQAGGLLGVFTKKELALTWARRQALVFLPESELRIQGLVAPLHKRGPVATGQ